MPFDLNDEPIEEAAAAAAEVFTEIFRGAAARRVESGARPEQVGPCFEGTLGDAGVGMLAALEEFRREVLPTAMGIGHPLYLGLVNSSPLPGAALADLLVSALNNNGGTFRQGPPMHAAEWEVVRWFARLFDLPPGTRGMVLPGGSYANLQAILLARTQHFPDWRIAGPASVARPPALYTSEASHFSVTRGAEAAGLGSASVVAVRTDGRGALDPSDLAARVAADRAAGRQPFLVVATAGTTGTGAIDPIREIAGLCAAERLWLHVDACYGGAACLLDAMRERFAGIERADSVSIDPHKWFFIPVTAGLLLTPHAGVELAAFDVAGASYIPDPERPDPYRRGLPTSRRASAMTIWMALRAHGIDAVRSAVRRNIDLTRLLERLLHEAGFAVLPGGELSIALARWEPSGWDASVADRLQLAVAEDIAASGQAWFSTVRHAERTWLRFNLVNLHTREAHVRVLADAVLEAARRLEARGTASAPEDSDLRDAR